MVNCTVVEQDMFQIPALSIHLNSIFIFILYMLSNS